MSQNIPKLSPRFPGWEAISNKYDLLFAALPDTIKDPAKRRKREESLYWERFAFGLIITMLLAKQIPFETSVDDVEPWVKDINGTEKEIDFRIRIQGKEVYFGATHFYNSAADLQKDIEEVDIPIQGIKESDLVQSEAGTIVSRRPHREYLNRRMVVRVAKEGKHKFDTDYIYIFFPKVDPGSGGGPDAVSNTFTFDSKANYEYRPRGITGLMLVGKYAEITPKRSQIYENRWLIRTLAFDHCSELMKTLLVNFDMTILFG